MKKVKSVIAIAMGVLCLGLFVGCGSDSSSSEKADTSSSTSSSDVSSTENDEVYEQDFTLINQTGVEINNLYISPSGEENWGSDVLTTDVLPTGSQVDIKFAPSEKSQYWDIKVSDKEGTEIEWRNIDLFTICEITLKFDGATPTASFK